MGERASDLWDGLPETTAFLFGRGKRPIIISGEVAYVPLADGRVAVIDAADAETVANHSWAACPMGNVTYAVTGMRRDGVKRNLGLHRLIVECSRDQVVDHIDCDGLNCRRYNLRAARQAENARNSRMRSSNTSGFKGVFWRADRQKWQAQIRLDRKRICLGTFETAEQAGAAYADAAKRLHGQFAREA